MKIKNIFTLVLALVMVVSCLGLSSFAAEEGEDSPGSADAVPYADGQDDGAQPAGEVVPADLEPLITEAASLLNIADFFRGTDKGLELDRAPSRAEAATMLVRMLGAEAAAASEKNAHPFTDVPATSAWAGDNIGYLYKNGLTKGVTETKFGDRDLVIAKQFYTFCLRALDYKDGEDFTYDEAVSKAADLGVITPEVAAAVDAKKDFTRGDMALAMFDTLKAKIKGGETSLVDTLAARGSVSAFSKEIINGTNELFNFMNEAGKSTDKLNFTADFTGKVDVSEGLTKTSSEMSGKILYDLDLTASSIKYYADMSAKVAEEATEISMYMDNKKMYVKTDGKWSDASSGTELDFEKLFNSVKEASPLDIPMGNFYKDLKMTKADGEVTIAGKVDMSAIMNSPFMKSFGEMAGAGLFDIGNIELTAVYGEETKDLKSMKMQMKMDVAQDGATVSMSMEIDMKLTDYGKTVITLDKDLQDFIAKQ